MFTWTSKIFVWLWLCSYIKLSYKGSVCLQSLLPDSSAFSFLMVLIDGWMSLLRKPSDMGQLMISGSMNSLSCMSMIGRKNLSVTLVKGFWGRILLIIGRMRMMSKSSWPPGRNIMLNNHNTFFSVHGGELCWTTPADCILLLLFLKKGKILITFD